MVSPQVGTAVLKGLSSPHFVAIAGSQKKYQVLVRTCHTGIPGTLYFVFRTYSCIPGLVERPMCASGINNIK